VSGEGDCAHWRDLEDQARDGAAQYLLDAEGRRRVGEAIGQARRVLGGDDVRSHAVGFDPARWQLEGDPVPDRLMLAGQISRGDLFDLAAGLPGSAAWPLFCCTYIWGQGRNGYGRARFDRITSVTPREGIVDAVEESVARQGACGPLSAYAFLRERVGAARFRTGGPRSSPSSCILRMPRGPRVR
jgi:hypothetical protein